MTRPKAVANGDYRFKLNYQLLDERLESHMRSGKGEEEAFFLGWQDLANVVLGMVAEKTASADLSKSFESALNQADHYIMNNLSADKTLEGYLIPSAFVPHLKKK